MFLVHTHSHLQGTKQYILLSLAPKTKPTVASSPIDSSFISLIANTHVRSNNIRTDLPLGAVICAILTLIYIWITVKELRAVYNMYQKPNIKVTILVQVRWSAASMMYPS